MKGPYERLKYDLHRVWECPACHTRFRTSGAITSRICSCQDKLVPGERMAMRLVVDEIRRLDGQPIVSTPALPLPEIGQG